MSAPLGGAFTRTASNGANASTRPPQLSHQQLSAFPSLNRNRLSGPPSQLARPTAAVLQAEAPAHRRETPENAWPSHSQNGAAKESDFTTGQLLHGRTAFQEEHKIRSYECGPDQATTVFTISNLLQEVAGNHGVALWGRTASGFATDPIMVEMDLIFVSTRIQVQMDRYPRWGDRVQIETWFQAEGRLAACRNWLIRDASTGEMLGRATSSWVMLNTKTRKLSKIPTKMREKLNYLAPNPHRDSLDPSLTRKKISEVSLPAEIIGPQQVARRSDMDMNGHINNVTYLGWALETIPEGMASDYTLHQVEIDFKSECLAGDTVESLGSRLQEETNGEGVVRYLHLVRCCKDGDCRELVRARSTWRPNHVQPEHLHPWLPGQGDAQ
ncbi:hypothetical protein WJX73_009384 [Symbiochloris irregularis]|uniref:Acyl-[acyl-carrier-protein] hydrolase n=1 Tax=Symbiochloris irregularis TaxID=706552 RepID=A0AAW1P373_9CHLO